MHFSFFLIFFLKSPLGGGDGNEDGREKNAINPFFDASGNKNIGATIRIGRDILCLPYAGFFLLNGKLT